MAQTVKFDPSAVALTIAEARLDAFTSADSALETLRAQMKDVRDRRNEALKGVREFVGNEFYAKVLADTGTFVALASVVAVNARDESTATRPDVSQTTHIREWLRSIGYPVSDGGRIPDDGMALWEAAKASAADE